jgi:hypothetical protein
LVAAAGTTVCVCTTITVDAGESDDEDDAELVTELVAWALPESVTVM